MSERRITRKPSERVLRVTESAPAGLQVKGAGEQLARLLGEELMARLRARQRAQRAAQGVSA